MKFFKSLWFIVPAILFTLYTLLGFFLVPYLITDILPQKLSESTNIKGKIQKVKFNPFTYKLDVLNGEFSTKDKKPLFLLHELNVTLKPSGIFSKDIRFEAINLVKPALHGRVNKKGEFNFLHLVHEGNSTKKSDENQSSWNVVIENLNIKNGEITFEDERKSYKTKLANLNYNATDLSTKKGDVSVQKLALTSTSAKNLTWSGNLSLNPLYSKGELKVLALSLNDIWSYSVGDEGIYPKKAFIDLDFSYDVKFENEDLKLNLDKINILVKNIQMYNKNQKISSIKNLKIYNALLNLDSSKKSKKLTLKNANAKVEKVKLFSSNMLALNADLNSLSLSNITLDSDLKKDMNARFSKSNADGFDFLYMDKNSSLDGNLKSITLNDFALHNSDLKLKKLSLKNINIGKKAFLDMPFLTSLKGLEIENVDFKSDKNASFDLAVDGVLLSDFTLANKNLPKPFLNVKTFKASKNRLNSKKYMVDLYGIDGLDVGLEFEKGYKLDILKGLKSSTDSNESDFKYEIKTVKLSNSFINFSDKTLKIPFNHKASLDGTKITNITSDTSKPINFNLNLKSKDLNLKTKGKVVQKPLNIQVDYDLTDKDITRNNPYVKEYAKLILKKGSFKTKGKFAYKNEDISVKADSTVQNVFVNTQNNKKLSSLKRMDIKGMDLTLKRLKLKDVIVANPKGYISVDKKGKTNISYLFPKKSKKKLKKSKVKFFVDIDSAKVKNGSFFFENRNLPKPSTISLTAIQSHVKSLYQSVKKPSKIQLKAKVDKSGYLETKGDLILKDIKKNTNVSINLKELDLVPLGGYLEKYVGYKLKEGTINTTYTQSIKNSKLKGDLQTELGSFYVGEKVKSKDAISVPLDLALAIMRDRDGNVNLNIPISGDLTDPKFKFGSIIVTAITNIFTNIVTAPFSLLGSILGIDGEKLKTVDFKPSKDTFVHSEEAKMEQYAKILKKRPNLKLTITGSYDESIDLQDEGENNESKKIDTEKLITLANKRANQIKENLIKLDIKADRIIIQNPVATKAYHGEWIRCKIGIKK